MPRKQFFYSSRDQVSWFHFIAVKKSLNGKEMLGVLFILYFAIALLQVCTSMSILALFKQEVPLLYLSSYFSHIVVDLKLIVWRSLQAA